MSGIPVSSFLQRIHVVLLLFVGADSLLVREPVDVFTVRGTTVNMSCYTNLALPVSWEVERTGGAIYWESIYKGVNGDIPDVYQYKYNVSVDSTRNQYNLTIKNVQPEDSGTYRCGDNVGRSLLDYNKGIPHNGATAELVVIEDDPKCRQEGNVFHLHLDSFDDDLTSALKMKCNITYTGNKSPNFWWSLLRIEQDTNETFLQAFSHSSVVPEGSNFLLSSELVMNALRVRNQYYVKFEILGSNEEFHSLPEVEAPAKTSWRSQKIKISYAELAESAHSSYPVKTNAWLATGMCMAILLILVITVCFCCFLHKIGFKTTDAKHLHQYCLKIKRIMRKEEGKEEGQELVTTTDLNDRIRTLTEDNIINTRVEPEQQLNTQKSELERTLNTAEQSLVEESEESSNAELEAAKQSQQQWIHLLKEIIQNLSHLDEEFKSLPCELPVVDDQFQRSSNSSHDENLISSFQEVKATLAKFSQYVKSIQKQLKIYGSVESKSNSCVTDCRIIPKKYPIHRDSRNDEYDKVIRGVTVVGERIFVIRAGLPHVAVYDLTSLEELRNENINIEDVHSPVALAGCAENKALYISDQNPNNMSIYKIEHIDTRASSKPNVWRLYPRRRPWGLSVTAEQTLLIVVVMRNTSGESRVLEYNANGCFLREITFKGTQGNIKYAHHIIQISRKPNQFIVPHGWGSTLHGICLVDDEGNIMKFPAKERGCDETHFYEPISLAIDDNSKRVYVADHRNHRVFMLDFNLTYLGCVREPSDLHAPCRIHFDPATCQLIIGEALKDRVIVICRPGLVNNEQEPRE